MIRLNWSKVTTGTRVFDGLECWDWTGKKNEKRYGRQSKNGKNYKTHRLAWVEMFGEIPDNLTIDHLCENTLCCNPYHMDVVPASVNTQRRWSRATPSTHCRRGHERTPENTYVRPNGERECLPCKRLVAKRWGLRRNTLKK